jgi:hypothetical protein
MKTNTQCAVIWSGRNKATDPEQTKREVAAMVAELNKRRPLYPPHRLARFAPFPWRGFAAVVVLVAIAAALFTLSR